MTRSIVTKTGVFSAAAIAAALAAGAAQAHSGAGVASGFVHPFTGIDHLLAMLAVGLWAGQAGRGMRIAAPAAFVLFAVAGAGLALSGIALPGIEAGIAASLIVVGLLVASAVTVTPALGVATIGAFAIFHGAAHGSEFAASSAIAGILGLAAASVVLTVAGIGISKALRRARAGIVVRIAGASAVAGGLVAAIG